MDQKRQHEIAAENCKEVHRPAVHDWSLFIGALAVVLVIFGFMYYSNYAGVNGVADQNTIAPSAGEEGVGPAAEPSYNGAANMRGTTPYNDDTTTNNAPAAPEQRSQP